MTLADTTTTVFWPLDERRQGIPYGWATPARICVAGVLDDNVSLEDAQERLNRVCGAPDGCKPTLLPDLDVSATHRIFYHRYPCQTLRYYELANAVHKPTAGFDYSLVEQFNQAHQVQSIVNGKSVRLNKPTAAFLLNFAATVIRPVVGLSRYARLPLPLHLLPHSAIAQQVKVRGKQAEVFLENIDALSVVHQDARISKYAKRYTSFFNDIWLLLNDYTIGFAFGALLCDNHQKLAASLASYIQLLCLSCVEESLIWLDSWPGGLKLNTDLSKFYSKMFISIVQLWGDLLVHHILPHTSSLVLLCGYASIFGGFTFSLALIIDALGFFITPHLTVCYILSRLVYSIVKDALGGLWAVFRGKRYNVLRNRMDTWDFDIDQLVFGTMLFTLLVFLFPTILAYYSLFAVIQLALLMLQAVVETLLAFMNHFPLFKLMLKVKDPARLPASVYFLITKDSIIVQTR
ncbi:phosphatidylinositol N-acetylglucosaminyltransferase subunit GPI1 [Coprinopsis cinerea okayama7|uniref:Phosphatidylinositol N-acetylglucosaminyltransferase subunit GPI1 n=1 Tax=Coprinopsis cinerea (strain Okayama-7 / 130 / ATCC MYA-4618 / FGSC 9003) TaxID=240176 RepID=A8P2S7_COPC7|nr:phosphatidylinositol N-acetylglucosaminyltransferase subunit GPI1 [Coprinopsis cinerea okayama7\|eukprot:XP_001838394.2 phosphatidylinositol N-acetylglucosaminyltransferase subunit GPI1 [Coprinopsis cinerea okayama7\